MMHNLIWIYILFSKSNLYLWACTFRLMKTEFSIDWHKWPIKSAMFLMDTAYSYVSRKPSMFQFSSAYSYWSRKPNMFQFSSAYSYISSKPSMFQFSSGYRYCSCKPSMFQISPAYIYVSSKPSIFYSFLPHTAMFLANQICFSLLENRLCEMSVRT